jgi:hypothetical protein
MMLYELIGKRPPIATTRRRDHRRCGARCATAIADRRDRAVTSSGGKKR